MRPALETAPFRDPGTTRPASRARPLPFHCPSPPSRTASWATPVRPCLPPVKAQPVHRRQDGRNAEPAALFPPAQLPNSLPGAVACPLSPPSFLPDILPGGTPRLDGIIPFGGPLGRIGPACRACTAPGFQLPFPSLPFPSPRLSCALSLARGAQCLPFAHAEPRIDPARHGPPHMRYRADKPVDGHRAGQECARQIDQHAAGRVQGKVADRSAVHKPAVPAIRPDAANRIATACPATDWLYNALFCREIFGLNAHQSKNIAVLMFLL